LDTATPWPLDLKLRCPDCGALIRGPAEAAVLACPGCDRYFANPGNSPGVRQRVRGIVAEQARIAELVNDLNRRLEQVLAEAEGQRAALAPLLAPCGYRLVARGSWSGRGGLGAFWSAGVRWAMSWASRPSRMAWRPNSKLCSGAAP
jgi:hypothetical protein